jgi:hypothetical protein
VRKPNRDDNYFYPHVTMKDIVCENKKKNTRSSSKRIRRTSHSKIEGLYKPGSIQGWEKRGDVLWFLVRWDGYTDADNGWTEASQFKQVDIDNYFGSGEPVEYRKGIPVSHNREVGVFEFSGVETEDDADEKVLYLPPRGRRSIRMSMWVLIQWYNCHSVHGFCQVRNRFVVADVEAIAVCNICIIIILWCCRCALCLLKKQLRFAIHTTETHDFWYRLKTALSRMPTKPRFVLS